MAMRVVHIQHLPEGQFTGEWENRFFLRGGSEVRLHCRLHKADQETYISRCDWDHKLGDQDRAFLLRAGVPERFYEEEPVARTTVVKSVIERKPVEPPKSGPVESQFLWESDIAEFIITSMDGHPDYRVEDLGAGLAVYRVEDERRLGLREIEAFRHTLRKSVA